MLDTFKEKKVWVFLLLILVLVISNVSFAKSGGWSRVGWQLLSFGGLFAVYKISNLTLSDIGLSRAKLGSGLKYALLSVGLIAITFLVVYLINQNVFKDARYDQGLWAALSAALVILPLKVVLFEEIAFRGMMPALLKDMGASFWVILVISSVLFGLWHILTAPKGNVLAIGNFSNLLVVAGVVLATTAAGAALYLLRYKSDSLIAPIAVHWFINGAAIVIASLAWLQNK